MCAVILPLVGFWRYIYAQADTQNRVQYDLGGQSGRRSLALLLQRHPFRGAKSSFVFRTGLILHHLSSLMAKVDSSTPSTDPDAVSSSNSLQNQQRFLIPFCASRSVNVAVCQQFSE